MDKYLEFKNKFNGQMKSLCDEVDVWDNIREGAYSEGKNKKSYHSKIYKRLLVCAATLATVISSLYLVGFGNVSSAMGKLFNFISGYTIAQNNDSIEYYNNDIAFVGNDNVTITLRNVVASKDNISIQLSVRPKNISKEQNIKSKQDVLNNLPDLASTLDLYINNTKYSSKTSFALADGNGNRNIYVDFKVKSGDISSDKTMKLVYPDYNSYVNFRLKPISSYNSLEEIGATGYNNGISITAVSSIKDDKLVVDLYPINKSSYHLLSLSRSPIAYKGEDLYLQTNKGTKSYITSAFPEGMSAPNKRFTFDLNDGSKEFTLKIPYIIVQSNEQKNISIPIPDMGQTLMFNQKVEFTDSSLIIKTVQRRSDFGDSKDSLKVDVEYENKNSNKIMLKAEFGRIDFWGNNQKNGGYSSEFNKDGIETTEYFPLEKDDNGSIRLKVSNPEYALLGEYSLKLTPE